MLESNAADLIILDSSVADLCRLNPGHPTDGDMRINLVMRVVIVNTADNRYTLITAYDTSNERKMLKRMLNNSIYVTGLLLIASFIGSFRHRFHHHPQHRAHQPHRTAYRRWRLLRAYPHPRDRRR